MLTPDQRLECASRNATPMPPSPDEKVGWARSADEYPINGLRHAPEGESCGWYLWTGEDLSRDPDFFDPLHVRHLDERAPEIVRFLALPPGWRFLIAPGYVDVWFDESLLSS